MWKTREVELGIKISATIPLSIVEFIVLVMKVVTIEEVDIGLKSTAILTLAIVEKGLMVMGDVDIGLRPENFPPITHIVMR